MPGLFAAGECAAGINGANRLGGNSLSDILVFGKRAGEFAAKISPKEHGAGADQPQRRSKKPARRALEPFERGAARPASEDPYQVQHDLQEMMQDLVGIVRREDEMQRALDGLQQALGTRPAASRVYGHREYNPGWHTALDLHNLLTVSEAITRSAHRAQGKPRRAFPRRFPRTRTPAFGKVNIVVRQGIRTARCRCGASRSPKCRTS